MRDRTSGGKRNGNHSGEAWVECMKCETETSRDVGGEPRNENNGIWTTIGPGKK